MVIGWDGCPRDRAIAGCWLADALRVFLEDGTMAGQRWAAFKFAGAARLEMANERKGVGMG